MHPTDRISDPNGGAHRPRLLLIAATLFASGLALGAATAQELRPGEVPFRSGTVSVSSLGDGLSELIDRQREVAATEAVPGGPARVVLQFNEIPSRDVLESLEDQGIRVLDFIGNNSYFATIEPQGIETLEAMVSEDLPDGEMLAGLEPVRPEYKLEETVRRDSIGRWAVQEDGDVRLRVEYWRDAEIESVTAGIEAIGATVVERSPEFNRLTVEVSRTDIEALSGLNDISWIEPIDPPYETFNDGVRQNIGADQLNAAPFGLSGQGIRVGEWDGGRIDGHDDFGTRIHPTIGDVGASASSHATHVAGTIGGSGMRSQTSGGGAMQWRGVAPEVDFYSWDFFGDVPSEVVDAINDAADGIHLSTNSWGFRISSADNNCSLYGDYPGIARDFDRIVRGDAANRAIPVLFAAGNERNDGDCGMSSQPPFDNYRVVSPPGTAKNIITVGATNSNDDTMTTFSSWGPVDDGRVKPDVTAPGCQADGDGAVTSTGLGNDYTAMCGTSMATPATAGLVALLLQHHQAELQAMPLPSTIKAILIHTADDLGRPGPDFSFGYGRINSVAAAEAISDRLMAEGQIDTNGQVDSSRVQVAANAPELRATLVWDDAAAPANTTQTLINDLDLRLIDPDGVAHLPFVLNPGAPANNAGRGVDDVNVVEQVLVENPKAGSWQVEVAGTRLAQGPQNYSLVTTASATAPPPPPVRRYIYTTLRVITKSSPRGCAVSDWDCMTRVCKNDLGSNAWRGWAGCNPHNNDFVCYFECGLIRELH